jgi:hypothetical protein
MSSFDLALPNSPFFLHMIGSGSTDKINYLIMQQAGRLVSESGNKFCNSTVTCAT